MLPSRKGSVTVTLVSILFFLQLDVVHGILPTAAIDVQLSNGTVLNMLVSQALFGASLKMGPKKNAHHALQLPPSDNSLLCQNVTSPSSGVSGSILLVPRGECTFEQKAFNAQRLGAKAILIYGTLESRYSLNATKYINQTDFHYTTDDIVYPLKFFDYDCAKGRADIPSSEILLEPLPYNAEHNNPRLSGPTDQNLCRKNAADSLKSCPSQACLLTGVKSENGEQMEACCAWDLHIWLYPDLALSNDAVQIPAAYLTLEQASVLLQELERQTMDIVLYARYRAPYNISSFLIWALGVAVAALAAYLSASDYRGYMKNVLARMDARAMASYGTDVAVLNEDGPRSRSRSPPIRPREVGIVLDEASASNQLQELPPPLPSAQYPADSLELNAGHALGFIVMASSGLLILFFFKVYNVVKVLYAFGCSKAVSQVIFHPLCSRIAQSLQISDRIVMRTKIEDIGDVTLFDVVSYALGYILGFTWLYVAFFFRHPDSITFFWVTQDIMGSCMCIMFLSVIKLNSIRVATLLLLVAFFYDIFFVFVTPLLFKGKSVMITVATSGGPPKADPSWCEKYPDDKDCQGGDPLPMLLTVPRIGDYEGGSSLLGLGDIVLPGLLLSFAARLDAAKCLLGVVGGGNGVLNSYSCPEQKFCGGCRLCSGGYFAPLVIAYAVGLLMANAAVYLMNMGQPALLYLVPACLGTITFMGWRRKELNGLWDGPKAIRSCDALIYGEMEEEGGGRQYAASSSCTAEDGSGSGGLDTSVGSCSSTPENDGDVPLLSHQT